MFGAFFDRNQTKHPGFCSHLPLPIATSFETTNPEIAGDGAAMAYRAGAKISHMGIINFIPRPWQPHKIQPHF